MTSTAIFSFIQGFHIEILCFLNLEGLHLKKTAMTAFAGHFLDSEMCLVGEKNSPQRLGVKNPAAVNGCLGSKNAIRQGMKTYKHHEQSQNVFHYSIG